MCSTESKPRNTDAYPFLPFKESDGGRERTREGGKECERGITDERTTERKGEKQRRKWRVKREKRERERERERVRRGEERRGKRERDREIERERGEKRGEERRGKRERDREGGPPGVVPSAVAVRDMMLLDSDH